MKVISISILLFFINLSNFIIAQNNVVFGDTINLNVIGYKGGTFNWQYSKDLQSWNTIDYSNKQSIKYKFKETGYFRCQIINCDSTYVSDTTFIQAIAPSVDQSYFKEDIFLGTYKSVFKLKDVRFCDLKVPTNYAQSQTHPSIVYAANGWNGYDHWIASTPYPKLDYTLENPCIYFGNTTLEGNPPSQFSPILNNPIEGAPKYGFNSDPDLFLENNMLSCIYRQSISNGGVTTTYFNLKNSSDGLNWSKSKTLFTSNQIEKVPAASPSIIKEGDKYRIFASTSRAWNNTMGLFGNFYILESDKIDGDYHFVDKSYFNYKGSIELWHFDIFDYNGTLYMVLCAVDNNSTPGYMNTYLAVSYNRKDFNIFPKPLFSDFCTYRPSFYINNDNKFVLYLSSVDLFSKQFSIDGREIGVVNMDFTELLKSLIESPSK